MAPTSPVIYFCALFLLPYLIQAGPWMLSWFSFNLQEITPRPYTTSWRPGRWPDHSFLESWGNGWSKERAADARSWETSLVTWNWRSSPDGVRGIVPLIFHPPPPPWPWVTLLCLLRTRTWEKQGLSGPASCVGENLNFMGPDISALVCATILTHMDWIKWNNLCKSTLKFSEGYPRYCLFLLWPLHRKGFPLQLTQVFD